MSQLLEQASRVAMRVERLRPAITLAGWIGFALVTADYAGFIDLPVLIYIPLWLAIVTSICRWALWEGLIKPKVIAPSNNATASPEPTPRPEDDR